MRRTCHAHVIAVLIGCTSLALAAPAQAAHAPAAQAAHHTPARAALPAGDGWASSGAGTTGGQAADAAHTFTVSTRAQLAAALNGGDATPKIIQIKGTIDGNTDAAGQPLSCADYATDGYALDAYLAAYDPATWGTTTVPTGPQEDARAASAARQGARVQLLVGSNTTIVGVGKHAKLLALDLQVKNADNVIVRNLTFEDAFDCFPQWDPTDGATGNWNSEYDNLVVYGATHVWIDHNTFTDGRRPDAAQPFYFGRIYQQHDGELDIVKGADLVTASWNAFTDHDKTLLFGNSDGAAATDAGKLRVTLHHNLFKNITERAPRVRFGQVDTYNNHYVVTTGQEYVYSLGVGFKSQLVAEANAFTLPKTVGADRVIAYWKGTAMTEHHNVVNGKETDLLGAFNAAHPATVIAGDAGWTPALRTRVDRPSAVPHIVDCGAGAGRL
ncbi:pectate lyase [Streptomyces sp. SPB162]|uniref:pectate lyase family protein n=1 Tax=Streptomyces sp. SPB162 TaxID=2940560 RepID=UPI002405AA9B|nr:pectate lyase [Streptomyces sp. SPB162]MDF9810970.1 pectate lyase [Streptomyces sp. SPB162]